MINIRKLAYSEHSLKAINLFLQVVNIIYFYPPKITKNMEKNESLDILASSLKGDLKYDSTTRAIYSTDASMYREEPLAFVYPADDSDIRQLIEYAHNHKTGLIMRGGGTSLAGQVVGSGIVVDISRYMNNILEINIEEHWVRIQPGVILEEMNKKLAEYGLFFGPETSTANRCTMGGMLGNNACGLHSLKFGSFNSQ
ncbi:MAG TPA: hypothetical protein DEQ09_02990 [Bacteroidales bacterium]|nr:hypothetical protein [Bacteroidales bacterium]